MPKYIVTLKYFCYLNPKKDSNKKTLVFLPRRKGKENFFWVTKTASSLSSTFDCVLYMKVIHIFAQVFNHNVELQ